MSIDRSNDLRSQTGLWSGEKFRNADVDRPVDEMEIENLDQSIMCRPLAVWRAELVSAGRSRGSSSAEARNPHSELRTLDIELWRPGTGLSTHWSAPHPHHYRCQPLERTTLGRR